MSYHKFPTSVKDAANLLDDVWPEWYEVVNLGTLDMRAFNRCLLAQLGKYYLSKHYMYTATFKYLFGNHDEKKDDIFNDNQELWIDEIEKRKANKVTKASNVVVPVAKFKLFDKVFTEHQALDSGPREIKGVYYDSGILFYIFENGFNYKEREEKIISIEEYKNKLQALIDKLN